MLLTRSRENCTTCGTRIVSFCLLLVGWLLRTRVGHPSKARGERATHSEARRGGGTGRRRPSAHTALEYEGPGLRVPETKRKLVAPRQRQGQKRKNKTGPPGRPPLQDSTRSRVCCRASPWSRVGDVPPREGRGVYGREKKEEKGDYGELQPAVCKRKYEGAEL